MACAAFNIISHVLYFVQRAKVYFALLATFNLLACATFSIMNRVQY